MKTVLSLLSLLVLISCQTSTETEGNKGSDSSTKVAEKEKEAQIQPEPKEAGETEKVLPIPPEQKEIVEREVVSETFMAFFEKFMWDEDYQKSRIEFPLAYYQDTLDSDRTWRHRSFYVSREYIPMLFADSTSFRERNISEEEIKMSIVSFRESNAENFIFTKKNGGWMLRKVYFEGIDDLSDSDFLRFLNLFSSDTTFQLEHISFPVYNNYADYNGDYETVYGSISIDDWRHINVVDEAEGLMILNIGNGSNVRDIFFRGIENGIHVHYLFKKIANEWKLTKLEDYST